MPSTPTLEIIPNAPIHHKGLHSEHAPDGVQRRGYVGLEMGVDPTDNGAASFYDGHVHPFSP